VNKPGSLTLVATPIGNPEDITLRAMRLLRESDIVVCEERKEGARLLHQLGITRELTMLNEHNEQEDAQEVIDALREGKTVALISDCGMPVIADPGTILLAMAIDFGIPIAIAPGANSFLAALALSGFEARQFVFRGMLSAKADERKREIQSLRKERRTVILFDAPYRLERLCEDLATAFGTARAMALAMDLTTPRETVLRGTALEIYDRVHGKNWKREFVAVLAAAETRL
jgi:16S rRNA (cytidine1402-2'-O)-methyltransferase